MRINEIELLDPGIFFNYPAEKYHRLPYVSNSYLTKIKHCPASAQQADKVTPALVFGRAFHTSILEPQLFWSEFFLEPDIDKRTSIGKRMMSEAILDNPGKEMVSVDDAITLASMKASVEAHPFARDLLSDHYTEVTLIWDHVMPNGSKIRMKARVDAIPKQRRFCDCLADLKSTDKADEAAFRHSILKYGYHRQAAIYLDAINTLMDLYFELGLPFPFPTAFEHFVFIAVEKKPPYKVECHELEDDFYQFGQHEYHELLEVERACREAKSGPVYPAYKNAGCSLLALPSHLKTELIERKKEKE